MRQHNESVNADPEPDRSEQLLVYDHGSSEQERLVRKDNLLYETYNPEPLHKLSTNPIYYIASHRCISRVC